MRARISRRSFLHGSALTTAAATSAAAAIAGAAAAAVSGRPVTEQGREAVRLGPEAVRISLTINGSARPVSVEPRTTLAEALRDALGLTGTKIACDRGACSACTVWLDGQPICSCMVLAIEIGARHVTTIEGLASAAGLHPVQTAFIEHDALQCGFCTPGMLMSCAALLERMPAPDAQDVERAISGHLCRCGCYPHVVAATLEAAAVRRKRS